MTVGDLKRLIADLPNETVVLDTVDNHSLSEAYVIRATALYDDSADQWTEDHGESLTPEEQYGVRRQVIIVV